jgi:hypothetical protein
MSYLLKDPAAVLDYLVDWGAEYLASDELLTSEWSVDPAEAGGVEIVASEFDSRTATAKAGGGRAGRLYRLTNQVVLASGRTDSRSVTLRVEKR